DRRVVRAEGAAAVLAEGEGQGSGGPSAEDRGAADTQSDRTRTAERVERGAHLRGPDADQPEDRRAVGRDSQNRSAERDRRAVGREEGEKITIDSSRTGAPRRSRSRAGDAWLPADRLSTAS